MIDTASKSKFHIFHYTRKSCIDWCTACDTGVSQNMSDAERGDLSCRQCQCFGMPFTFIADIITLPYRGIKYLVTKNKKTTKTNVVYPKTTNTSVKKGKKHRH
jgi:hypothetical protein